MAFVDVVVGLWDENTGWLDPEGTAAHFETMALERAWHADLQQKAVGTGMTISEFRAVRYPRRIVHVYWDRGCRGECGWGSECPFGAQYDHRIMAVDLTARLASTPSDMIWWSDIEKAICQIRMTAPWLG